MRICTVVGARPQFVKAGAVSRRFLGNSQVEEVLIHTGQHYDANMSAVFFEELAIPPAKYNLGVGSGSHARQTSEMLTGLETILLGEEPDVVMIYGDTNSTLAAALVASKLHIPVAHVEAGLRSFNRRMPEEINRIVSDSISDLLFAPTEAAESRLLLEGQPREQVILTGDVMYDAALLVRDIAKERSTVLEDVGVTEGRFVLATVHRAENTDHPDRLKSIVRALELVSEQYPVVLPLHPRTRKALGNVGIELPLNGDVRTIDPVGFVDMVRLEMAARFVASDSGGVQKEAFFYGVPCFVLREETEWVELIEGGWNALVPAGDPVVMAGRMLAEKGAEERADIHPYGRGDASQKILEALLARYT